MKILIVDDTRLSRSMIRKRIPEHIRKSATIIEGTNGLEAVALYKEHLPDLLFLDLTMPEMDGFEALECIMQFDPDAVVYVITADIQTKTVEKVTAAGARNLEAKPVSEARLAEIFNDIGGSRS